MSAAPGVMLPGRLAQARLRGLGQRFVHIAQTRMAGLPIVHPGLSVALEGFREQAWAVGSSPASQQALGCTGVLITPWTMSLLRLPLSLSCEVLPLGHKGVRRVGQGAAAQVFDFIGGSEEGLGPFEMCSLFSPMTDFADQAAAVATARAVMDALFVAALPPATEPVPAVTAQAAAAAPDAPPDVSPQPARRWFLRGGVA
ncbi:[NiFe]-hydrogenase assembly chaperone HybE [Amphibiibacter pelophylacis]|uniref:[NiFe]-hydrogenase assembly chaperone HybE n=1 Tax=Amphibiibacter pelophylacis TaxID=1799477 RepID=A0ACC6P015_9BURK